MLAAYQAGELAAATIAPGVANSKVCPYCLHSRTYDSPHVVAQTEAMLSMPLFYAYAQITEEIGKVAKSYGVKFIAGARMHQMKQYIINGNKTVVLRDVSAQLQQAAPSSRI